MVMGPITFPITFELMNIPTLYNLLLGLPWIHMASVVPSTLHQYLKFEYDYQKLVIHGERGHPIYDFKGKEILDRKISIH